MPTLWRVFSANWYGVDKWLYFPDNCNYLPLNYHVSNKDMWLHACFSREIYSHIWYKDIITDRIIHSLKMIDVTWLLYIIFFSGLNIRMSITKPAEWPVDVLRSKSNSSWIMISMNCHWIYFYELQSNLIYQRHDFCVRCYFMF